MRIHPGCDRPAAACGRRVSKMTTHIPAHRLAMPALTLSHGGTHAHLPTAHTIIRSHFACANELAYMLIS